MTFWYSNNQHIYKTGDIVKLTKASYYVTPHDNLMFLRYSEETNMCYVIHKTRDGIRCWNLSVAHIVPSESTECRFSERDIKLAKQIASLWFDFDGDYDTQETHCPYKHQSVIDAVYKYFNGDSIDELISFAIKETKLRTGCELHLYSSKII